MSPGGRKRQRRLIWLSLLIVATLAVVFFGRPILIAIDDSVRAIAAYRYVEHLGDVDEIEICSLGGERTPGDTEFFEYADRYAIVERKTVRQADAAEIAALWRKLPTGRHRAMCLDPAYGLRFRHNGHEILKTSACWECEGVALPAMGSSIICGFDAKSEPALKLLEALQKYVPLPVRPGREEAAQSH